MRKLRAFFVLSLLACFCLSATPALANDSGMEAVPAYEPVEVSTKSVTEVASDVVDTQKTQAVLAESGFQTYATGECTCNDNTKDPCCECGCQDARETK